MLWRTLGLSLATMLMISTTAEANGSYSRRAVVYREAPEPVYVYERRPAPFIALGVGHTGLELYHDPPRVLLDVNPFHDPLFIDPYVGGTLFGVDPFIGRRHFHFGGHRHFRHRGRR